MGPGRSSVSRIGRDSSKVSSSGQTGGESNRLAAAACRVVPKGLPSPLGKGKGKINEIIYPEGSEYLRGAVQNVMAMGPSRIESLFGEIFTAWYRPLFGVQVWRPDVLTSYVVQVAYVVLC